MNRAAESGLEVEPRTDPEVSNPYNEDKEHSGIESSHNPRVAPQNQSHRSENNDMGNRGSNNAIFAQPDGAKSNRQPKAIWVLAVLAVIVLAVALGAGLGLGLAGQNKSSSPA